MGNVFHFQIKGYVLVRSQTQGAISPAVSTVNESLVRGCVPVDGCVPAAETLLPRTHVISGPTLNMRDIEGIKLVGN